MVILIKQISLKWKIEEAKPAICRLEESQQPPNLVDLMVNTGSDWRHKNLLKSKKKLQTTFYNATFKS